MNKEIWKDVKGFNGKYQVSSYGRVKSIGHTDSLGRYWKSVVLRPAKYRGEYLHVHLTSSHSKQVSISVHQLVARAFIPNPNNYPQVNHKDEDPTNNHVDNLEWCTAQYNVNYGHHNYNTSKTLTRDICALDINTGDVIFMFDCARDHRNLGFAHSYIQQCAKHNIKQAYGFHWEFTENVPKEKLDKYMNVLKRCPEYAG